MILKFRQIMPEIEAARWWLRDDREIVAWLGVAYVDCDLVDGTLTIESHQDPAKRDGRVVVRLGEWIVKMPDGNFRVWEDTLFRKTYDLA